MSNADVKEKASLRPYLGQPAGARGDSSQSGYERRRRFRFRHVGGARPNSRIKDEERYEALRRDGASKEKAARISNASAASSRSKTASKGGKSGDYEDWGKSDLVSRARDIGIDGGSKMNKDELIDALRNH